ncbi:chorion peroxidase-like, partial [Diabrotica undecimpunctata]
KSQPKQSVTSHSLPSPIDVASTLQSNPATKHESVTALLGAWTELLLHDLASTGNMKSQDCCSDNAKKHGECYGKLGNGQCREYMRTLPAVDMDTCEFGYRDQMNLATSFLDASAIYGNTDQQVENLRTYDAGLVNVSACSACRSNALYSAILKEHNRVAVNLAQLNKHWNDEVLFYESRRIVIAELQHITYNEYLPIVLGEEAIVHSELELKTHGRFAKYSSTQKVGVFNEVAISALPVLLSMLPISV